MKMSERLFEVELQYGLVTPDGYEVASEFISIACISILSFTLGLKTYGERIRLLSYGRILVILLYTTSWAFSTLSVIIVSTNNNNIVSCTIGMLGCDIFYAGSKVVIYAWLIERVYLVTAVKTVRMQTKEYRMHFLLLCPYIAIFALMMTFRNIYLEPNGECTMGLTRVSSIPLMVYDFFFNCYLTWLFIRPLTGLGRDPRTDWKRSRLYKLARRTLVASVVCLLISLCNVGYAVISNGHQRGLICLTMCTVDVTVNVVTVHWVTTGNSRSKPNQDEQATGELTFHEDRYTTMRLGTPTTDREDDYDDTSSNNSSTADVSHSSRKPMNLF